MKRAMRRNQTCSDKGRSHTAISELARIGDTVDTDLAEAKVVSHEISFIMLAEIKTERDSSFDGGCGERIHDIV